MTFPKITSFRTPADLRSRIAQLGLDLPLEDSIEQGPGSPLASPIRLDHRVIGNRFAILPMEGWDGTTDGRPTDLTRRRWRRFGESGAKLIWGGEAVAVRHDGRANPNQLLLTQASLGDFASLRADLVAAHQEHFGSTRDLLVGLQLTHSGRFARPNDKARLEPRIAYRHPLLDARFGILDDSAVLSDGELDDLVGDFVSAAVAASQAGFDFVDIKHCHGYLGHELLTAVDRPGRYGGSLENRARFLCEITRGIQRDAPGLAVGVRLSLFDHLPFQPGPDRIGQPTPWDGPYRFAFGSDPENPDRIAWDEPLEFLRIAQRLGIRLICMTAGCPYYSPHLQRPAAIPPTDGYLPPEDPLVGVARQAASVAHVKKHLPDLILVGSGYSYLQEWLPHVAQAHVRLNRTDAVGLGRMVLSYPGLPADVLQGRALDRRRICRTFSECTSAPRNGLVSGCYPLDDFYRARPEAEALKRILGRGRRA